MTKTLEDFKIGDYVIITNYNGFKDPDIYPWVGKTGKIIDIDTASNYVDVSGEFSGCTLQTDRLLVLPNEIEIVNMEHNTPSTKGDTPMTTTNVPFTITKEAITVFVGGKIYTVNTSDTKHGELKALLQEPIHDVQKILDLLDRKKAIMKFGKGLIEIKDGQVYFKGNLVNNSLTTKMISLMDAGISVGPWVAFMENLDENPSWRARQCLFDFLEKFNAPITPEGNFLAFKKVRPDFKDIYTGKFDNSPGQVLEMDRRNVDEDPTRTCSSGLHVCSYDYLDHFGNSSRGDKIVLVEVNPRDVVSVPIDYNLSKMRLCRYKVIQEIQREEAEGYYSDGYYGSNSNSYGENTYDCEEIYDDDEVMKDLLTDDIEDLIRDHNNLLNQDPPEAYIKDLFDRLWDRFNKLG